MYQNCALMLLLTQNLALKAFLILKRLGPCVTFITCKEKKIVHVEARLILDLSEVLMSSYNKHIPVHKNHLPELLSRLAIIPVKWQNPNSAPKCISSRNVTVKYTRLLCYIHTPDKKLSVNCYLRKGINIRKTQYCK